jgi:hypothetical protein
LTPVFTPLTTPISNGFQGPTLSETVDAASVFDDPSVAVEGAKKVFDTPEQDAVYRMKSEFMSVFQPFAMNREKFHAIMNRIYGYNNDPINGTLATYSEEKGEALRLRALSGDYSWLPKVRFVPDEQIGAGKNGIYDSEGLPPTVYMSDRLLKDPVEAQKSFTRAVGFHLDKLTDGDNSMIYGDPFSGYYDTGEASGNEGELFRAAVADEPISGDRWSTLAEERVLLVVEGHAVQGEPV